DCSGSSRAAGGYTEGGWAERPEEAPEQPSRSAACRTGLLAEGPRAAKKYSLYKGKRRKSTFIQRPFKRQKKVKFLVLAKQMKGC
ncbi:MAG: hypothetical protein JJU02_10235, partial [Cryomorphaceae bacterium]|nr:hypothetical protein [Cryomorphaceae bacterium]